MAVRCRSQFFPLVLFPCQVRDAVRPGQSVRCEFVEQVTKVGGKTRSRSGTANKNGTCQNLPDISNPITGACMALEPRFARRPRFEKTSRAIKHFFIHHHHPNYSRLSALVRTSVRVHLHYRNCLGRRRRRRLHLNHLSLISPLAYSAFSDAPIKFHLIILAHQRGL